MLIGIRLKNERLLQQHVVYDLEFDGAQAGRFTWQPRAQWNKIVLHGRKFTFGSDAQSIGEQFRHILSGGSSRPFVIRDEKGDVYAQAQLASSTLCAFNVGGRTFRARKIWGFRHVLSITDETNSEVGTVRFRKVDGVKQIVVDMPGDLGAPVQIMFLGILHALIERNQGD